MITVYLPRTTPALGFGAIPFYAVNSRISCQRVDEFSGTREEAEREMYSRGFVHEWEVGCSSPFVFARFGQKKAMVLAVHA